MSVVKINALEVPPHLAKTLEERFANRAGEVERLPGFEGFSLLRPTDDDGRYFVVTRWRSEEDFQRWIQSPEFQRGHAQSAEHGPAATHSRLLSFEVVLESGKGSLGGRPEERPWSGSGPGFVQDRSEPAQDRDGGGRAS